MHIVCPNCAASYQVARTAIGPAGRQVRCVRCRSIWFQTPLEEAPLVPAPEQDSDATVDAFRAELGAEPAPEAELPPAAETVESPPTDVAAAVPENGDPAGLPLDQLIETAATEAPAAEAESQEQAAPALSDIAIPSGDVPQAEAEQPETAKAQPDDVETIANRRRARRKTQPKRGASRSSRMTAAILALACTIAAMIVWRDTVVRHAPQMASLYAAIGMPVNLRGLIFAEVRVSRDAHDGVTVLVVEGTIASTASKPVAVPRLRFAMRNDAGGEVYAWTAMPTREVLEPGETLPFRSRLASPPSEGRDVTVRFFNRLDAIAGLR